MNSLLRHLLDWFMFAGTTFFAAAAVADAGAPGGEGGADSGGLDPAAGGDDAGAGAEGDVGSRSSAEGDDPGAAGGEEDGAQAAEGREGQQKDAQGKLDARTLPPKVKEAMDNLQKVDPKAHGWLKDRLWSERQFRQELPGGVQEAKALKGAVSGLRELVPPTMAAASTADVISTIKEELSEGRALDDLFVKGDPQLFEKMIQFSADGFKKLLPVALRQYAKMDVDGYRRDIAGIIAADLAGQNVINRLGFVNRLLAKGDVEGVKEEIAAITEGLKQYETIANEKPRAADPNPQDDQRQKDLDNREFKLWTDETARPINAAKTQAIKNELKQYTKDQQIDDDTYEALEAQCLRYVNELLHKDPNFAPTFNAFVENRDREGITRFMASKLKEVLPSKVVNGEKRMGPVERAYKLFFKGSAKAAPKPGAQPGKGGAQPQKPAPKGWERISPDKAPQPHEIDRARTPFEMSFQRAAVLRNGKKVFWGDQAPA